jgi:hypothetical protein
VDSWRAAIHEFVLLVTGLAWPAIVWARRGHFEV